jgi:antitoxin PrlF
MESAVNLPVSRITSKSQTVIPKAVRDRLGLKPGDLVRYVIQGKRISIERARTAMDANPFATFDEWASDADENAYNGL